MLLEELQVKFNGQISSMINKMRLHFQDQISWISDRVISLRSLGERNKSIGGSSSNGGIPRSQSSTRKMTSASKLKSPMRAVSQMLRARPFANSRSSGTLIERQSHSYKSSRQTEFQRISSNKKRSATQRRTNSFTYFGLAP